MLGKAFESRHRRQHMLGARILLSSAHANNPHKDNEQKRPAATHDFGHEKKRISPQITAAAMLPMLPSSIFSHFSYNFVRPFFRTCSSERAIATDCGFVGKGGVGCAPSPFSPFCFSYCTSGRTLHSPHTHTSWDVPYCLFIVPLHLITVVLLDRGGKNREKNQWRRRKNHFLAYT